MSVKITDCIGRIGLHISFDEAGEPVGWDLGVETNGPQSTGAVELLSKAAEAARAEIDRQWQKNREPKQVEG